MAVPAEAGRHRGRQTEQAVFCPIDDPLEDTAALATTPRTVSCACCTATSSGTPSAATWPSTRSVRDGERCAYRLETTWLPTYEVPATIAPPAGDGTLLAGLELSMEALATRRRPTSRRSSGPLARRLRALARRAGRQGAWPPGGASGDRARPRSSLRASAPSGSRRASTLLADPTAAGHEQALKAFRFANKAMLLQRQHTTIAALRGKRQASPTGKRTPPFEARAAKVASWRPFQLAFVLLNLPALTDPGHATATSSTCCSSRPAAARPRRTSAWPLTRSRSGGSRGTIDTGEDARSGDGGVAVLMRYTLRLLTAQQFQRAAALVCAAEVLRREDETTWGKSRSGSASGSAVRSRRTGTTRPPIRSPRSRDSPRRQAHRRAADARLPVVRHEAGSPPRPQAGRRPAAHPAVLPVR